MKGLQLMREASKTASVFGNKNGVAVSFEGKTAKTDGKKIILPMVDEDRDFSNRERSVARGYLDHEAGHIKHTEMAVMGECTTDDERSCLNFLEDARIERMVSEEYIGAADNLGILNDVIAEESIESINAAPIESLGRSVFYAAIFNEHHRRLGIGEQGCERYLAALPEDMVTEASSYVDDLLDCKSTRDVHKIVKRLIEKEEEKEGPKGKGEEPEQPEQPEGEPPKGEQPEPPKGQKGEKGEGEGEEGEQGEGEQGEDGEEKSDGEEQSETGGKEGESKGKPSAEGTEDSEGETGKGQGEHGEGEGKETGKLEVGRDGAKALSEVLGVPKGEQPKWRRYRDDWDLDFGVKTPDKAVKKAQSGWKSFGQSLLVRARLLRDGDSHRYSEDHQKIKGSIGKIKRELENKLLAKRDLRWESGQKKGRFDVKRCVAAYGGSEDVFEIRREDQTLDTVVTLLVDHSGSMTSMNKMGLARLATICLGEVLAKVGVPFRVVGFDSAGRPSRNVLYGCDSSEEYSEMMADFTDNTPIYHMVYKDFDESFSRSKSSIGAMSNNTSGSHNCDAGSINKEWDLIKGRYEEKKMIIVMSDGSPETYWKHTVYGMPISAHRVLYQATKSAIQQVIDEGGVISGIGIADDSVKQLYPESVVINDVKDLPLVSLRMLEKGIFGSDK